LQGFDDEDFYRAKERLNRVFYRGRDNSNSQLYKQAGNSITVNVLEKIFNKLFKE
jgi:DNA (cytosine-5)-methyltransferase 1